MFYQSWNGTIMSSSRYNMYREFKIILEPERYLSIFNDKKLRNVLVRFRSGILRLRINEGRWQNIELSLRLCPVCNLGIEDEFHFLLVCPHYNNIFPIQLRTDPFPISPFPLCGGG